LSARPLPPRLTIDPASAASGNPWFATTGVPYVGDVSSHVDIISVAMKYRWDDPAPAPKSTLYHK